MTLISYDIDHTDITEFESVTGVSAYGGGQSGLSADVDFRIQRSFSVTKQIKAAELGFMYDNSANFTIGSDDHFHIWIRAATPGVVDTIINRGIVVAIGDDTSNFVKFHVNGSDTLPLGGTINYAVRFVNTAKTTGPNRRTLVGSPGTTPSWIGGGIKGTASVKSANLGIDAARIGTGFDITGGTGADPPGDFKGIADWEDDSFNRWGAFRLTWQSGAYNLQGKLRFGGSSNECEFADNGAFINMVDAVHALSDYNEILIEHADTIINLSSCTFKGLGTTTPGRFEMITSAGETNLTRCTFLNFGDTILGTGASFLGCNWINTDTVTANGADLTGSNISKYEVAVDTSPLIWNVATNPDGLLDDMAFEKGTIATHAIEFGTISPTTIDLNGIDFSGYHADNGENDSTLHILRTVGTVTINIIGGSGNVSYKSAGATVIIVQNPVTLALHVTDITDGSDLENARCYVIADSVGGLPFEDSVTITRVTTTATVAHTAHGLANGEKVIISGAAQDEYNGIQTISNVSANGYDYTVSGTPTTPATGTIISTAVIIDGNSDSGGLISNTRAYTTDQSFTGRVRKSSASIYYKTSPLIGTIDKDIGVEVAVQMVQDE